MRDTTADTTNSGTAVAGDTQGPLLAQAEQKNDLSLDRPAEETTPVETPEGVKDSYRIVLTGEYLFEPNVIQNAAKMAENNDSTDYSFLRMYSGLYTEINGADLAVGSCSTPMLPYFSTENYIGAPVDAIESLKSLGLDAVSLVGSHMLDGGSAGMTASLESYYEAGVMNFGIYTDTEDYDNIRILKAGELNVAFLGFSGQDTADTGYLIPSFTDEEAMRKWIEYADFVSDLVIVSVDWAGLAGNSTEQTKIATLLADCGADIIFGNGDAFGAVEYIDTGDGTVTLCAYSLGGLLSCASCVDTLGGMLAFDINVGDGQLTLKNAEVIPICTYHSSEFTEIQTMTLNGYETLLSQVTPTDGSADTSALAAMRSRYEACVPAVLREKR